MRQLVGLSEDGQEITLKRFQNLQFPTLPSNITAPQKATGLYLDVETTGKDRTRDKIIDLAYIIFEYDRETGYFLTIKKSFSSLEDPEMPIPENIQKLTGIKNEDVKGKKIDWKEVEEDFRQAQIIISHNAAFDRAFVDRYLSLSKEKVWGCSVTQVDWREKGHGTTSLEYLCKDHGYFFQGHRAMADVLAGVQLLSLVDPDLGRPYLFELLSKARIKMKWIYAYGSSFDFKDILKGRNYLWDAQKRVWKISVPLENTDEEKFLGENKAMAGQPKMEPIPLTDTFKSYL